MHQVPNERITRMIPKPPSSSSTGQDHLLWISKHQQQHPLTHVHPLKNTIRINSRGIRYKFDGKQWRPLCQSTDGFECRNLAFRSSLCQKHFYKIHLFKRPYGKNHSVPAQRSLPATTTKLPAIPPLSLKRSSLASEYEQQQQQRAKEQMETHDDIQEIYEDEDTVEVIENNDAIVSKQENDPTQSEYSFFSIDSDPQMISHTSITNSIKSEPSTTSSPPNQPESLPKRSDSTNTDSVFSTESESSSSLNNPISKLTESIRHGISPLTRTEEKSLATELINQYPIDISFTNAEQMARRRVCEIVYDNYSYRILPGNISSEWFYDFLLRNPRVPIHFQSWFSSIKSTLPLSDHLIDIKIWELGLITRSVLSSS